MSYLVLARKYRPQTFEQVIGQDHVSQTLINAIASDRVAHAILFSGPRGTGKTTVARILSKAINCINGPSPVPCNTCRSCREITAGSAVDVFEIDGASNNSVEQVRDLRENVKYMPAHSSYKIYIIDEVHMLSTAAFNALLKTLEEPPPHVIFLFATTEPQKIPITILSRCQRHDFRRIHLDLIIDHMEYLCNQEGIEISSNSLWIIAREADGSMRDALSLLDQVMTCSEKAIDHEYVLGILGLIDRKLLFDFSETILKKDIPGLLDLLDHIYDHGHDMKKFYGNLIEHFRNLLIIRIGKNSNKLVNLPVHEIELMSRQINDVSAAYLSQVFDILFKEEAVIRYSTQPKIALEILFIRMFEIKPALPIDVLIDKLNDIQQGTGNFSNNSISETPADYTSAPEKKTISSNDSEFSTKLSSNELEKNEPEKNEPEKNDPEHNNSGRISPANASAGEDLVDTWKKVYAIISKTQPALAASMNHSGIINRTDKTIEIEVNGNDFKINMVKRDKNMVILKDIFRDYFNRDMEIIICPKMIESGTKKKNETNLKNKALSHPMVSDALEIFNGKIIEVKLI